MRDETCKRKVIHPTSKFCVHLNCII